MSRTAGLTLAAALLLGACGDRGRDRPPAGGRVLTEQDFLTDADRRAFLQEHLPVQVPHQAGRIRFKYDDRLQRTLVASFVLPKEAFESYRRSLVGPQAKGRCVLDLRARRGLMRATVEFIPAERKVEFDCRAAEE